MNKILRLRERNAQLEKDLVEAGTSRVSNATFTWRKSTPKEKVKKRTHHRQVKKDKKAATSFSYVSHAANKRISVQYISSMMEKIGAKPAQNRSQFKNILFRKNGDIMKEWDKDTVFDKEIFSLTNRLWICILRYQYLRDVKYDFGVPGARRGTHIHDLAMDLEVPSDCVEMYKNNSPDQYFYYPPMIVDLYAQEQKKRFKEHWYWLFDMGGLELVDPSTYFICS